MGAGYWLGFDPIERSLEQLGKHAADSWPPYNIEQIGSDRLEVTLAVAGFAASELRVTLDQNHLLIQGKKADDATIPNDQAHAPSRIFLYRGIASRQFQRHFILGHDIRLDRAELAHGLLVLSLSRPPPPLPKHLTILSEHSENESKITLTVSTIR